MLEAEGGSQTEHDTESHRCAEGQQEDANTVEEGENVQRSVVKLRQGSGKQQSENKEQRVTSEAGYTQT